MLNSILMGRWCVKATDTAKPPTNYEIVGAYLNSSYVPWLLIKRIGNDSAPQKVEMIAASKVLV
jgi:hypothetical protein